MTWVFDTIQKFLRHISTVDDPKLFKTAIGYISKIMGSVHDIDHALDHRIAKAIEVTNSYKRIKEFNQEAERRGADTQRRDCMVLEATQLEISLARALDKSPLSVR